VKKLFTILIFLLSSSCYTFPYVPNPDTSPGHLCTPTDYDFSRYRYPERIPYCERNVSYPRKQKLYDKYNIPKNQRRSYTIDHIICLCIGGSNWDKNLWPEHKTLRDYRKPLEYDLYLYVREGRISQKCAVEIIKESKFDRDLLLKPRYESYGGLENYINRRGIDWENCDEVYRRTTPSQ